MKPCALKMGSIVLGKEAKQKLQAVPLFDNIISSRICDISYDILNQVIIDIKNSLTKISLQLDESTDISSCCQLLTMVRYVKDKTVKKEFLFCKPLQTTSTARDVFNLVKKFFKYYNIDISLIGSICAGGTPAMLGNRSGFAALLKKEVPTLKVIHCMIHRQVLASKSMPESMKNFFDTCIKMVNFIRKHDTNHRIFQLFCDEMSDKHCILLYHNDIR